MGMEHLDLLVGLCGLLECGLALSSGRSVIRLTEKVKAYSQRDMSDAPPLAQWRWANGHSRHGIGVID